MSAVSRRPVWGATVGFCAVFAMAIAVIAASPASGATTFVVDTNNNNPGLSACTSAPSDCSLPGAVAAANATMGEDTITFDIPAGQCIDGVCRIDITQGPMMITESVIIDGSTQPQNDAPLANVCATETSPSHPRIEVVTNPNEVTNPDPGAFIINHAAGSSAIRGLAIGSDESPGVFAAIQVDNGSGHHIACNHLELDAAGSSELGTSNLFASVLIQGAAGGVIVGTDGDGFDDVGERNVFGPGGYALYINENDANTVAGNYFGISAEGTAKVGSGRVFIRQSSNNNVIGTNEDGTSDGLERNYFGAGVGVDFNASHSFSDNVVVGNTFGVTPTGAAVSMSNGVLANELSATGTGIEIRNNTFGSVTTAIELLGAEPTASVLISGNYFGVTEGGAPLQGNSTAIELAGSGNYVVTSNYIANSKAQGLGLYEFAELAGGSVDNCFVGNVAGLVDTTTSTNNIENNWWGATDGPSGAGSGSGDSVSHDVDFTPWLESPPAICNQPPMVADASFEVDEDAAIGTVVGTVVATDEAAIGFAITGGDPAGHFAIADSGEITVAAGLDFETTSAYTLTVTVSDSLVSADATVTIDVIDVFEVPSVATFGDVPLGHNFFANVEWLADAGITRGCNPPANDMFCPDQPVTRGQMAAFLRRALADDLTPGEPVEFTDDDGSIFEDDIEWLAAVRVTKGCNPPVNDMFCPEDPVTRGQMAAFLARAFKYQEGAGSDQFTDDDGSPFEANIERLAFVGVTRGCNPPVNDMFCPNAPVTRAQMAAFLNRAMAP